MISIDQNKLTSSLQSGLNDVAASLPSMAENMITAPIKGTMDNITNLTQFAESHGVSGISDFLKPFLNLINELLASVGAAFKSHTPADSAAAPAPSTASSSNPAAAQAAAQAAAAGTRASSGTTVATAGSAPATPGASANTTRARNS